MTRTEAAGTRAFGSDVDPAAAVGQSRTVSGAPQPVQQAGQKAGQHGTHPARPRFEPQQPSLNQLGAATAQHGRVVGPASRRAPTPPGGLPLSSKAVVIDPVATRPSMPGETASPHGLSPGHGVVATRSHQIGDQSLAGSAGSSAGSVSRERIVLLSIAFVSLAIATMLHVQFFVPLITSALAGASTCTFFMLLHDRAKKSAEIARLAVELARQRAVRPLFIEMTEAVAHGLAPSDQSVDRSGSQGVEQAGHRTASKIGALTAAPTAVMPSDNLSDHSIEAVTAAVDRAVATRRHEQRASGDAQNYNSVSAARWDPVTQSSPPASPDLGRHGEFTRQGELDRQGFVQPNLDQTAVEPKQTVQRSRPITSAQSMAGGTTPAVARDQWAFRPRDAFREPGGEQQRTGAMPSTQNIQPQGAHSIAPLPEVTTIETDLALVQRKIKALADEVNGAEVARAVERSAAGMGSVSAQRLSSTEGLQTASEFNGQTLDASIGALKSAAATMRGSPSAPAPAIGDAATTALPSLGEFFIPATAQRIAASGPPEPPAEPSLLDASDPPFVYASEPTLFPSIEALMPVAIARGDTPTALASAVPQPQAVSLSAGPDNQNSDMLNQPESSFDDELELALTLPSLMALQLELKSVDPKIAAITRAIEHGRMDVMLSPIVGLMTHEVTHYDVKVLLKTEAGGYFDNPAQDLLLDGSDVLALFDTARLTRAAALARRLDARGKTGALLSEVTGPSLTNGGFLESFARIYEERDRIAGQLVLTFSQADTEHFTPSAWQALSDMHAFGFRFALERLDHLSVDFAVLAQRGFALVKVDANVLLSGMPSADRFIPSDEVCRRIAGAGLTLIADAVDDDSTRARLFGFGVLFGQGQLFGGARLVSVDPTAPGSRSPAAA